MLSVDIFDDNNKIICHQTPLSLIVDRSLSVPCDSAVVVLPYKEYREGATIKIYDEKLIFCGIIDEEITIFNSNGNYKKYVARSKMALLLDNQAYPCEMLNVTRTFLGNKYLKNFSVDFDKGEEVYSGKITVDDGMTVYDVFAEFCNKVFSSTPRITEEGKFLFVDNSGENVIEFNNLSGAKYTSLIEYKKRCEQLSKVSLMTNTKFYDYIIENEEIKDKSICRERFLDATAGSNVYPSNGESLIEKSNMDSYEVEIVSPNNLTNCLGYKGVVKGMEENLIVSEIQYTYNSSGEETKLILRRSK